ncbi:MAG TPA: SUMF1/EgtB/PvdO family nonheme iron enzyme, partial [Blastocatellia bacterium]|nr:SUMF1/EgtB/PvdO family nonheme iron enzyme [Blastocatellia bacterium]
ALLAAAILSLYSATGQERGQGVKIKVETGQEIDLYDESHALVIGVSDYNNGWKKLPGVIADVAQVGAVLEQQGFNVVKLMNPTRREFDDAIQLFISQRGLKERNRLVIYFAGHGYTERLGDDRDLGYIVMRNAAKPEHDQQQFSLSAISMDEVNAYALRIKSKHALFVFDSCFAGSLFRSDSGNRRPPQIESKSASPVRQFITSGTAGQEVPDDSIFRRYFVRAFEERLGDLDGDGYITGEELGIYLSGRVASDSRDTQTPRYGKIRDARLNIGDIVFALKATPVRPINPCAKEEDAWNQARSTRSAAVVRAFLREYPNCQYAANARILLASLEAPASVDPSRPAGDYARVNGNKTLPMVTMNFTTAKVDANGRVTKLPGQTAMGYTEQLPGGVKLEMVEIAGGSFLMGTSDAEAPVFIREIERYLSKDRAVGWTNWTRPQRRVTVGDFYIGKYEVTQVQWKAVMGNLPPDMDGLENEFMGDDLPIVEVSWDDAKRFIDRLNNLTGGDYRFPSEAEWEYAARAGSQEAYSYGPTITPEVVNYDGNYPYGQAAKGKYVKHPAPVGSYPANGVGLFEMHGNVWEWCEDDWHSSYNGAPTDGRVWVDTSVRTSGRVNRGGSWDYYAVNCRSESRYVNSPGSRNFNLGFRLSRTAK